MTATEHARRMRKAADWHEAKFAKAVYDAFVARRKRFSLETLTRLLEAGDRDGAARYVDALLADDVDRLAALYLAAFLRGLQEGATVVPPKRRVRHG